MSCLYCKYARRAENKDYVGCIKMLMVLKDNYADYNPCEFYDRDAVCTGWVNTSKSPFDEAKQGMITNGIPCFRKTDRCKYFEGEENG